MPILILSNTTKNCLFLHCVYISPDCRPLNIQLLSNLIVSGIFVFVEKRQNFLLGLIEFYSCIYSCIFSRRICIGHRQ